MHVLYWSSDSTLDPGCFCLIFFDGGLGISAERDFLKVVAVCKPLDVSVYREIPLSLVLHQISVWFSERDSPFGHAMPFSSHLLQEASSNAAV
jgi:hypothetical protein